MRSIGWLLLAVSVSQAQEFTPVSVSGPTSNRFNIVFFSEGYTSAELPQFRVDATNAFKALLAHQPYTEYATCLNAFAIAAASTASGSDHPASGIYHATYFNSSYDASDTLITIPPNAYDTNYAHGQGKIDALLKTFLSDTSLAVLLVNDRVVPGGSDGFDKTAIVAMAGSWPEILTHETGHVVAGLGDEYTWAFPGFPDVEEPNTTRETRRELIKWKAWILPETPVPTPIDDYSAVGLFEGAHYHASGWYRPQGDCAMRSQYVPFCAVCSEALVLNIIRRARPIDGPWPANPVLAVSSPQILEFGVTPRQLTTHALAAQWFLDGIALPEATNYALTLPVESLGNGVHAVDARVSDPTALVRNDPGNLLAQTRTWTLVVDLPVLRLDSQARLADGSLVFRVAGTSSRPVVLQSSSDLRTWHPVATNSFSTGFFWHTNPPSSPSVFFRAKTPPA